MDQLKSLLASPSRPWLAKDRRCLLKIPIEVLEMLAAKLSINDLLALSATCRELRGGLEDVRLTRTEGLIVKYHEKMRRNSFRSN